MVEASGDVEVEVLVVVIAWVLVESASVLTVVIENHINEVYPVIQENVHGAVHR